MLRTALLTLASALVLATPAAAGWVERQPPLELPEGASCLRSAGPGQLTVLGRLGTTTAATDVLAVGELGIERRASVTLGWLTACAEVGAAAGVPPLLAGPVVRPHGRRWRGGVRAQALGERPASLRARRLGLGDVAVAVAAGGAAIVAWTEDGPVARDGRDTPARLLAAVRPPGSTRFGRPTQVARGVERWGQPPVVGIDRSGRAHVGWIGPGAPESARDRESGGRGDNVVRVASAPPRRGFGEPHDLARTWGDRIALAVAADGGALLVALRRGDTGAWERRPGERRFARSPLPSISADEPAVALAPGGGAVLAYRNSGGIDVLRRRPGGRFRGAQTVFPVDEGGSGSGYFFFVGDVRTGPSRPQDPLGGALAVRLAADGSIVVAWVDAADEDGTTEPASAHAAHGTLAGGFPETAARLGGPCRAANATTPVQLAGGRLGVAWTDNAGATLLGDEEAVEGHGQVHVAVPGPAPAPLPVPAAPGLVAELAERSVRVGEPLHVRVRCADGPCDVRALTSVRQTGKRFGPDPDAEHDPVALARSTTLAAGVAGELVLEPPEGFAFARPGTTTPVQIALVACAPAGPVAQRVTLEQPLHVPAVAASPRRDR